MDVNLTGARTADFLLAEANGERSRGLITIPSGAGVVEAGTIVDATGAVVSNANAATAAAIVYGTVDATNAVQKAAAITRDAEVHGEMLKWPSGATASNKLAFADALADRGIVIRWTQRPTGLETDEPLIDEGNDFDPSP